MSKKNITLTIVSIISFFMLAIAIQADYLSGFESWVYNLSVGHMSDFLTYILIIITNIGGPIGIATICLIVLLIPKLRNNIGIPVYLSVSSSFLLDILLKQCFARERPNILRLVTETNYSFPSGHAMVNMALYSILVIYTYNLIKNKKLKTILITIMSALVILIGFTRIYLGVHYAGDIIGGWLLGFADGMIIYMIMKRTSINE